MEIKDASKFILLFLICAKQIVLGQSSIDDLPYGPEVPIFRIEDDVLREFIQNLTLRSYSELRPHATGPAVAVSCSLLVEQIGPTDERHMNYGLEVYIRYSWTDPRLTFDDVYRGEKPLQVPPSHIDKFWRPDIAFTNMESGKMLELIRPYEFLRIFPNGTVLYSARLSLVLSCDMKFSRYPFDRQICSLKISSYMYTRSDMTLSWCGSPPGVKIGYDKAGLDQFNLEDTAAQTCERTTSTGDYPCIQARFLLVRRPGFVLLQTYIPSILIVVVSWLSFWIHPDVIAARTTLGGTTIITMATVFISKGNDIDVSYPKAIDYWVTFCMIFVFFAFLESILISYVHQRIKKEQKRKAPLSQHDSVEKGLISVDQTSQRVPPTTDGATSAVGQMDTVTEPIDELGGSAESQKFNRKTRCSFNGKRIKFSNELPTQSSTTKRHSDTFGYALILKLGKPSAIDRVSRLVFPMSFVIFNVIYWAALLGRIDNTHLS